MINITPICNAWGTLWVTIFGWTKYFFYALVMTLYPLSYYRFYIRKGETPLNDWTLALKMCGTTFFCAMAYWSHA